MKHWVVGLLVGAALFGATGARAAVDDEAVVLLLHGNGAAGTTNAVDDSAARNTLVVSGHVQHATSASVFGGSSLRFDGTGDGMVAADSENWNFGTNDFTIDLWMRNDRANAPGLQERLIGQWETESAGFTNAAYWTSYDAAGTGGLDTRGYRGAAFDGRYVYFAPQSDWVSSHGRVLRYDTMGSLSDTSSWAAYEASTVDGLNTRGYHGATFDGRYVYFVPRSDGDNHGRVLRYDTRGAFGSSESWAAYDAGNIGGLSTKGYSAAVYDGQYLYFSPLEDNTGTVRHGRVLRYNTREPFQQAGSWSAFDAGRIGNLETVGFHGALFDGRYAYFVPHMDLAGAYHGRVLRYDTRAAFAASNSWSAYDASGTASLVCKGYMGGAFDGRYVYFAPFRDGWDATNRHGRVLRYDTQGSFTNSGSWSAYDAGSVGGLDTKGYSGALFDGRYVYFTPFNDSRVPHGRVLRYDTQGSFTSSGSWRAMDAGSVGGLNTKGFFGGVSDGKYLYFVPCNDTTNAHARVLRYDAGGGQGAFELSARSQEQAGGYSGAPYGLAFRASAGGNAFTLSANQILDSNAWHHVAVTRAGGALRLFVDGSIKATNDIGTNAIVNSSSPLSIGRYPGAASGFAGYLDEVRVLKGIARWTESFTNALPVAPYQSALTIAGQLTNESTGVGLDDVVVQAGAYSAVTTNGGYYTVSVPYEWTGTVAPVLHAASVSPASRSFSALTQDQANQDFGWKPAAPVVTGATTSQVITAGGALITLTGADFQSAWYSTNWLYRKRVSIDRSNVLGALTNYPMLVRRTDREWKSTGNGGRVGQTDGGDFVFTDGTGTNKLAHEIEKYDPATGELLAWVNVPLVTTNADTELFVYYGNASAANQWNATGTWNSNYKGVYHLNDSQWTGDDFTGTSVDTSNWGPYGIYSINNNRLAFSTTTAQWNSSGANGYQRFYGDFDIYVDYNSSGWSKPSTDAFEMGMFIGTIDGAYGYYFSHMYASTGVRWYNSWQTETNSGWGSLSSGVGSTGSMRLIRTGSTIYSYYWNGSAWVQVGSYTGAHTGDPVYLALYASNRTTGRAMEQTFFDHLVVAYGTRVWDSTAYTNHAASIRSQPTTDGRINAGRYFDGGNTYIEIKNSASLENLQEGNYSLQAWYQPASMPNTLTNATLYHAVVMKSGWHAGLAMRSNTFEMLYVSTGYYNAVKSEAPVLGQFYSMVGVVDHSVGSTRVYLNGEEGTPRTWSPSLATYEHGTTPWRIGIAWPSSTDWQRAAHGVIDEVRLLATPLSSQWVATEYNNHSAPDTFYSVGVQEDVADRTNANTQVFVNGVQAQIVSVTPDQITIRVTDLAPGPADVVVVSPDGGTSTLPGVFYSMPYVAGRVTDANSGRPVSGVALDFGSAGNVVSDGDGWYTQYVSYGWSGTITPSLLDASFAPETRSFGGVNANLADQDFSVQLGEPVITSFSPPTFPSAGGAWVEVNGESFRSGWYSNSWSFRKRLSVDRTKISAELTNFPMLVSRVDADLKSVANGGRVGQNDGGDLLFTDATGTNKLAHEVESYNPATGELVAWVNVPLLGTNRDTEVYLYYGNAPATDQWNPAGTWNSSYRGVWHLNDPDYSDAFSGTNLDTVNWITSGQVIQSNGLVMTTTAAYANGSEIKSKQLRLVGDFDMNVSFDASSWSTPPADEHQVVLDLYTTTGTYCGYKVYFLHRSNGTRSFSTWQDESSVGFGGVTTTQRTGRLRMWRNGSLLNAIYWNGSSWVSLGTFSGTRSGEPLGVRMYLYNGASYSAVAPTYLSNFQIAYGGLIKDSTAYSNHAANISSVQTSGMAGLARRFDGNNSRIEIRNSSSLQDLQEGTYSVQAWYQPLVIPTGVGGGNNTDVHGILMKSGWHEGIGMGISSVSIFHNFANDTQVGGGSSFLPAIGQFYDFAGVVDISAGKTRFYLNGQAGSVATWTPYTAAREYGTMPWRIGIGGTNNAPSWRWAANGVVDEARLVAGILSPEWLATEYLNHNSPESFYSFGIEERASDWTNSGISRVFVDGQLVDALFVDSGQILIRPSPGTGTVSVLVLGGDGSEATATTSYAYVPPPVISGHVVDRVTGSDLDGAILSFSGASSVTSDVDGAYAATLPYGWSGTMTISRAGYSFRTSSLSYVDLQENVVGLDWYGTPDVLPVGRDIEFYARYLKGNGVLTNYTIQTTYASIPVEFINVQGSTNITGTWSPGSGTADQRVLIVRVEGDLTVAASGTIIPSARKRGMVIYTEGNANILGRISMTARGAANVAGDRLNLVQLISAEVSASGAAGGAAVSGDNKAGSAGNAGSSGSTGGGGAGGANNNSAAAWPTSGAGAAGTSYSGGSGGGGAGATASGTAGSGAANGGAGGNGYSRGGGGAGNPAGSGGSNMVAGTGGLLVMYAGGNLSLSASGLIDANGSRGGDGQVTSSSNVAAGGGGSGGGSVNLFYQGAYANAGSGNIQANGGSGGTIQEGGSVGGNGGNGTVRVVSYKASRQISGRVIESATGNGIVGATITASPNGTSGTTTNGGYFTILVSAGWSGTLTARYAGGGFSPSSRAVTSISEDLANQNFAWIPPPVVAGVSPVSGPTAGGTAVFITGTNFSISPLPTVRFGGVLATGVTRLNDTTLQAVAPANPAGRVVVSVTDSSGLSGMLTNAYLYVAPSPTITDVLPADGATAGGYGVQINYTGGELWPYRRAVTLSPATSVTGQQVRVTLTTATFDYATARSGGADLRFTQPDGTVLPHWVETWNTSGTSYIWVQVWNPGISTIYLNYGHPTATNISSGEATFDFFDDFNSLDTSKYNYSTYYSCANSILTVWSDNSWRYISPKQWFGPTQALVFETKVIFPNISANILHFNLLEASDASSTYYRFCLRQTDTGLGVVGQYTIGSGWVYSGTLTTSSANQWYISQVQKRTNNVFLGQMLSTDYAVQGSSYTYSNSAFQSLTWGWSQQNYVSTSSSYDWWRVRKYVPSTVNSSVGARESAVQFDGVSATSVSILSPTSVVVVAPVHAAGSVPLTLISLQGGSNTLLGGFTFTPVISGRVTNTITREGVDQALVTLSGGAGSAVTTNGGYYIILVSTGWSGTASVSLDSVYGAGSFTPASRSYGAITNSPANQDYGFTPSFPVISGRVINEDTALGEDGVTVNFSNSGGSTTTTNGGYYSRTVPYTWTGTVTFTYTTSRGPGEFEPASRSYANVRLNQADQDYVFDPPYFPGTRYVSLTGLNQWPYTNWETAARSIQLAVNAAGSEDTVLVADGTYNVDSRLTITKWVNVKSVNGPAWTTIQRSGSGAYGVVYISGSGAVLDGFTVRNGMICCNDAAYPKAGGVQAQSGAVVQNCIIRDNFGGMYLGAGGLYLSRATAINCLIVNNSASGYDLYSACGGVKLSFDAMLINCVVSGNSGVSGQAGISMDGHGSTDQGTCWVRNSIIQGNSGYDVTIGDGELIMQNTAYGSLRGSNVTLENCLTSPAQFINASGSDYRLSESSPLINRGVNGYNPLSTDMAGSARVSGSTIDLGVYEFQNARPRLLGRITHLDTGAALAGITVQTTGGNVTTDSDGYYSRVVESGWSGTVTPTAGTGTFSPTSRSYNNVTADVTGNFTWAGPPPFVSGRITQQNTGAGVNGVTVTFSNGGGSTTTTNGGYYSLQVARYWTGSVTPSYSSGSFSPASRSYNSLVADQGAQDFSWIPPTRTISGRVTHSYTSAGVDGLTVTLSNSGGSTVTTNGGYYTAAVLLNWSGRVTVEPGSAGATTPSYRDYTNVTTNMPTQDAVWTPSDPVLSGRVYHAYTNGGVSGVIVAFSGAGSVTSTTSGAYSKTLPWNWNGTVTVSYTSGTFAPASRTYASLQTAQSSQDYAWYPVPRTISGTITHRETGAGIGGVTLALSSGGSVVSAANGTWSYTAYTGWKGTITPSLSGGVFDPVNRTYSSLSADQLAQDFGWGPDKTISGRVTNEVTGVGLDGIVLTFSGSGSATTAGGGYYSKTISYGWSGSVSLSGPSGGVFTPNGRSYSAISASLSGQDYGWQAPRSIAGRVADQYSGEGVDGVTITLSNGGGTTTTAGGGYWSKLLTYGWSGTITPSGTGTFNPSSRSVSSLTSDLTGQDFGRIGPNPAISGSVLVQQTGAGQGGIVVQFSDGVAITTAVNGAYSRTLTHGWSGTITLSSPWGGTFSPSQRTYADVHADQSSQNFTWTAPTYPISGRVTHETTGAGVTGLTVSLNGIGSVFTASGGYYTQWVYRGWSGTSVVSATEGGTFSPAVRAYSGVTNTQSGQDFVFRPFRDITGRVVDEAGQGVDGIALAAGSNVIAAGVSADGGYYTLTVTNGWTGTVTPTGLGNNTVVPVSRGYVNVGANISSQNYTVIPYRVLSGRITDAQSGEGLDGIPVTGTGVKISGLTAAGGYYTVSVTNGWTGSLRATLSGGVFTPSQRNYTSVAANQIDQDYTWQAQQTISGVVTNSYTGDGVSGVTITFAGAGSTVSGSGGSYTMTVSRGWSGVATPSYGSSGSFNPNNRSYAAVSNNLGTQNYSWTPSAIATLSGRVVDSFTGTGLDGVTISIAGGVGTTVTAGGGYWSKIVPIGWNSTVTPSYGQAGSFSPGSRSPGTVSGNLGGLDFVWTPTAVAGDRYVSPSGSNIYPYTSWTTAARDPRLAIRAAGAGETVWVTNGVYDVASTLVITNAIRVYSVNGADYTTLRRSGTTNYTVLEINHANSVVHGLTVRNGVKPGGAGGVNLLQGYLVNSIIISNQGAGVVLGNAAAARLANVVVARNSEDGISGVGSVVNCTVANNGGNQVSASVVYNSIVRGAISSPVIAYTIANNAYAGTGNLVADPLFEDEANNNYRVRTNSPAINAGRDGYNTLTTDLDGKPRVLSEIDMGAYELTVQQGLAVALGADPNPVPRGDRITWIVTALNAGPGTASNVLVTLPAPSGVTLLSNSAAGAYASGVWTVGALPMGSSAELRLWALAAQSGLYTNVARINSANLSAEPGYGAATNVIEILGPVTITNVVASSSSSTSIVEWASVVGIGYDIYVVDGDFTTNTQWNKRAVMVASEDVRHYLDANATPASVMKRFYQVSFANQTPSTQHVWGIVRRTLNSGYTMLSAPLKSDLRFDGEFGAQLAQSLTGDNGGTGDSVGDEIQLLQGNGSWRTLYLDQQKVWRESNGNVSTLELEPGQGFFVVRYAGGTTLATFTGEVGNDGGNSFALQTGWNLIGLSQGKSLPVQATLASGSNGGPIGGASEENADQIVMMKSNGSWRRLMYIQGWGAPYDGQWFDLSTFTIATVTFEPGDAVYYFRQGGVMEVQF